LENDIPMKSTIKIKTLLLVLVLAATGCSDDEKEKPVAKRKLAESMKFTGGAEGVDEGVIIECLCDLALELPGFELEVDGTQQFTGTLGGEIIRAVADDSGAGFSFAPFLFGEVTVTVKANDSLYLSWPGNLDTGIPFYDEISLFKGVVNTDGTVSGTWKCAPLNLDEGGYVDVKGVAEGTWGLEKFE
jgi:hypothetical protein